MLRVFTDGACKGNGKKGAVASYAAWYPEHPDWSFAHLIPDSETQTNQRGELKGIYEGVKVAYEKCGAPSEYDLEIYTDSMYAKNCLTTWLPGWLRNEWKTSEGKPVIHRDIIEEASTLLPKFKSYKLVHVKAHTNAKDELSKNNAIVDKMAVDVIMRIDEKKEETKEVSTEKGPFESLNLTMMGPPMEETKIVEWCKTHLHELDEVALRSALFSAFQKTIKKNGYDVELQRLNKSKVVRLIAAKHLIKQGVTIIKQDD